MAYRFRRQESVADGVRRIVRERLDKVTGHLSPAEDPAQSGIHEARKRFKEIRAVLRLVQGDLGDRYLIENHWYRDAGRALAGIRELQAAIETWHKLRSHFVELHEPQTSDAIETWLQMRLERQTGEASDMVESQATVLESLSDAYERINHWPVKATGFTGIKLGARSVYRRGRQTMQAAYAHEQPLEFHAWRKRVKDLWYHTRLLKPVWGKEMSLREAMLKTLSDTLGDDHDLVVFTQLLKQHPELCGSRDCYKEIRGCISLRQQVLRRRAYGLGCRVYAEKPKAYIRRIETYWRIWRPDRLC
ncbi:CHAD domain-containing protein [Acidihalobacter prosperus]